MQTIILLSLLPALCLALTAYSAILIFLRAKLFKQKLYKPMLLNIGLAWTSVLAMGGFLVLAMMANNTSHLSPAISMAIIIVGILVWLLLLPNAPYLITELNFSHRRTDDPVPLYFDIIQTLSLTMTGIMVGQLGLVLTHLLFVVTLSPGYNEAGLLIFPAIAWVLAYLCIFAAAFAIYLGRNIRVNSWDILHPLTFARRLGQHFSNKEERQHALGYTIFYGIFLAIFHTAIFGLIQASIN